MRVRAARRLCRVASPTTVGHLQRLDALRTQLGGHLTTDLVALLVLERPRPLVRIETDPDRPTGPPQSHAVRPVVQRDFSLRADLPGDQVRRQQVPDLAEIPGPGLVGRDVGMPRVPQAGIDLPPRTSGNRRIQLPLPAIHHLQVLLQLGRRATLVRLGPRLANALGPLHHAVGLRSAGWVGTYSHPQARQPQDQVGRQVATRAPGRPVVDPQLLRPAPPREQAAQRPLGGPWFHLTPEGSGGKRPSARQPQWPHRRSATNKPVCRRPRGFAPRHPSASSGGPRWPGPRGCEAAYPSGPAPGPLAGTSGGVSAGWANGSPVVARVRRSGSRPPPRWDGCGVGPGPPRGARPRRSEATAWACDSRAALHLARGRGIVSGGAAPYGGPGRRRSPDWPWLPPAGHVGAISSAPGWARVWASKRPPRQKSREVWHLLIRPCQSHCGKTS